MKLFLKSPSSNPPKLLFLITHNSNYHILLDILVEKKIISKEKRNMSKT